MLKNPIFALESTPSATVVINKFQYNPPLDKNEWVELYNPTDLEIDLNTWQLVDESNTKKLLIGKKIAAKSVLVFEDGNSWLNNTSANNSGDTVFLKIGDSIIDQVDYKRLDGKILVKGVGISTDDLVLKGKWIGRSTDGSDNWQVFTDTIPPTGGGINYFNGYKNVIEKINVGITVANDSSGIGLTEIRMYESNLENNNCLSFNYLNIGSSLSDGRCYKFEYVATDGVGNTGIFSSGSVVKFDTSKPDVVIKNAFRNIKKLKSEFEGVDPESGILNYKYNLGVSSNWMDTNNILNVGYSGDPKTICGKSINNAGLESEISCLDFITDLIAPKVGNQINPQKGKYKIGDRLPLSLEFSEAIETTSPELFKVDRFNFVNKNSNILNFEYQVKTGDLSNNLEIGETKITVNGGQITDMAGNEAELKINNLEPGIEIDGVIPLITLIGETYVEIPQFGNYLDLGVTVSDGEITVKNNVNASLGGIYEVNYTVTDDAGNKNFIDRKVKVVDTTAPVINQLSIKNYELRINSNEEGYLEWVGKCRGENNNLKTGDNIIKIKNAGDGVYDDCEIRAWDKWGNVGLWQKVDSFVIDTTAPVINFVSPTPDDNTFVKNDVDIVINSNENLKECFLEKENMDNWEGDWTVDLKNQDLVEKSIWQEISMESEGVLSFRWRVSSEKDWDYLKFYVDGVLIDKISGESGWEERKHNLNSGDHTIRFTYSKDYSSESGEDQGWIDEIKISGGGNITNMEIKDNMAQVKILNLGQGVTKYKVSCIDLYDNKTISPERKIIKETAGVGGVLEPTPTAYTIFKSSVVIPTVKVIKPTATKTPTKIPVKKSGSILGVKVTPTSEIKISPVMGIKLKTNIPWEEIKFWGMGMLVLGIVSGVVIFKKDL